MDYTLVIDEFFEEIKGGGNGAEGSLGSVGFIEAEQKADAGRHGCAVVLILFASRCHAGHAQHIVVAWVGKERRKGRKKAKIQDGNHA